MEANELRIGNWVYGVARTGTYQIDSFGDYPTSPEDPEDTYYCIVSAGYPFPVDLAEPIPLTEEWLEKFGFKKVKSIRDSKYIIEKSAWQIKSKHHADWESFEFLLKDYPEDNPNCGILIKREDETYAHGVPKDLLKKEKWSTEDIERAANHRIKMEAMWYNIAHHIKYVHQLQNLYFALTGQELTIHAAQEKD